MRVILLGRCMDLINPAMISVKNVHSEYIFYGRYKTNDPLLKIFKA